jgi:hypothetical protein
MNIGLCVGLVLFGLVCGYLMLVKISRRVEWYVPSLSTAELCKELRVTLSTFQALSDTILTNAQASKEAFERITAIENRFTEMSLFVEEQLEKQLRRRFSEIMPSINEDLLRRVASQIATEFKGVVDRRTMNIGSEYVLLQSIDNFEMDVQLDSHYSEIETIQRALVAALRFEVKRTDDVKHLAQWLEAKQWNEREFRQFAGHIGSELFKLKWHGTLALRRKGEKHVQVA